MGFLAALMERFATAWSAAESKCCSGLWTGQREASAERFVTFDLTGDHFCSWGVG